MSGSKLNYQQAIDWVFGLINYERKPGRSRDFRLDRTRTLLEAVGNPHEQIPVVHIAGTKGKGSTASMCAAALTQCGLRTGLFTSPHITRFEERLRVDEAEPAEQQLITVVEELQAAVEECDGLMPTYFEAAMLMAWCFFRNRSADIAVLEVGLGGRLDATNVCHPAVCVITSISLDHTNILGGTLDKIAAEKAGIIKSGIPVVSGVVDEPARSVIRRVAAENTCRLTEANRDVAWEYSRPDQGETTGLVNVTTPWRKWNQVRVPLPGSHQAFNTMLALTALDALNQQPSYSLNASSVLDGLATANAPARVEIVGRDPLTIVDAAHNTASIKAFVNAIDEVSQERPRVCIFATTKQKDVAGMLGHVLPAFDHVVLTEYIRNPRAVPVHELSSVAEELAEQGGFEVCLHVAATPTSALELARATVQQPALLCTTGSFFIAAEIRELCVVSKHSGSAKKKAD